MPRLQGNINSYKGRVVSNRTDLSLDFNTGSVRHQLVTGLEYYEESYRRDPYHRWVPDIGSGRRVIDVRNPDAHYSGPWTWAESDDRSGARVRNTGLFVYDQITLSRHWEVAAGLRYDYFHVNWYDAAGQRRPYSQSEGAWSGRLGVVYKPVDYGSIYLSYSEATQPSAAAAASRSGGGGNDDVGNYSPGEAKTWELGTKWDLIDERLALTAALFQVERSNPSDSDPDDPGALIQSARKDRVRGFELGLAGSITPKWSAYGGVTVLNGKIIEDQDDPSQEGGKLKNVPKATFNLWTTYAFDDQWDASLGAQYVGKRRFVEGNTVARGASADEYVPSFWLFHAAVGYQLNRNVSFRLNVNNIFDKFYYQQGSASSDGFQLFGVPGAGRSVVLSTQARF